MKPILLQLRMPNNQPAMIVLQAIMYFQPQTADINSNGSVVWFRNGSSLIVQDSYSSLVKMIGDVPNDQD